MSLSNFVFGWMRERRRRRVLASLTEVRLALDMAWTGLEAQADPLASLRTTISEALKRIESDADDPTKDLESLDDQIQHCAAKRAYWLNPAQILTETDSCIRELRAWGVPKLYFDEHLKPLSDSVRAALADAAGTQNPEQRRAAVYRAQTSLEAVFLEYVYWDGYTDGYVLRVLLPRLLLLGVPGAACLLLALVSAFYWSSSVLAVGLAGMAGTCASIVLRQEPMAVYGDAIKSWIWLAGRLITGLVATVVGMGLLSSGLISVGFSDSTAGASENPVGSAKGLVPLHAVVRTCLDFEGSSAEAAVTHGRQSPDAGTIDALASGEHAAIDAGNRSMSVVSASPVSAERPCRKQSPCGKGAMLLVLGFAMLFGFSERAFVKLLGTFEEQLGGGSDRAPMPPSPPVPSNSGRSAKKDEAEPMAHPPQPPAQASGEVVTPAQTTSSAAVRGTGAPSPGQPPQRTPTSPGLPVPSVGRPPKVSGT